MKITLNYILFSLAFLISCQIFAQQSSVELDKKVVGPEDLEIIIGKWEGKLTYIDYSSNKPYTMPANVSVVKAKNKNKLSLHFKYPNEPKANSKGQITISKKGDKINKEVVVSKRELSNGQVQITTEYNGQDNRKKALIRNEYIIGSQQFVIRKIVKFENSNEWIMRNEYSFNR